jgi:hypothetical protein
MPEVPTSAEVGLPDLLAGDLPISRLGRKRQITI